VRRLECVQSTGKGNLGLNRPGSQSREELDDGQAPLQASSSLAKLDRRMLLDASFAFVQVWKCGRLPRSAGGRTTSSDR